MSDQLIDESQLITGGCKDCPPGTYWGCCTPMEDDDGYPLGPPMIGQCIDRIYNPGSKSLFTGSNVFVMRETSVVLYDERHDTVLWTVTASYATYKFKAITYSKELDEYFASGYHLPNNQYNVQNFFVLRISNNGTILQTYSTQDTDWGGCGADSSLDIVYKDGGIYLSGYWQYLNSYWSGVRQGYLVFDLQSGVIAQVVGSPVTQTTDPITSIAISDESDVIYIGRGQWMGPSSTEWSRKGELLKGVLNDPNSFTVIETGNKRDITGHINEFTLYASHIKKVGKYLCVCYGYAYNDSHWIGPRSLGSSYSDEIDIYDFESGTFIKTLKVDLSNDISIEYGNSFGYHIAKYGNYIFISADSQCIVPTDDTTGFGAVYMYDKDFNFIQKLTISPVLLKSEGYGYHMWVNSDTIFIGNVAGRNYGGANTLKECSYSNFGIQNNGDNK